MNRHIFRNANLLDGKAAARNATVVVAGDRIQSVHDAGEPVAPEAGDVTHDLGGRTVMPGMIAGHLHMSYRDLDGDSVISVDLDKTPAHFAILASKNAADLIHCGVTAGIGAGSLYNLDATLKLLIEAGEIEGPRMVVSGRELTTTGGPFDLKPHWWKIGTTGFGAICDGAEEFRKAVREETQRGVEIIKLYPEGGRGLRNPGVDMTYDEIAAAADTAHSRGVKIRAHCVSKLAATWCVKAGVDIIDHADEMDDELIEMFVEKGVFVLPSLYCLWKSAQTAPSDVAGQMEGWLDQAAAVLPRAVAAGVRFVSGDDFGARGFPHAEAGRELAVYTDRIGIDPLEVIRWATGNAGEMAGLPIGRIVPGYYADLLVVDGDPVRDMRLLGDPANIAVVMKGGRIVRGDPAQLATRRAA